VLRHLACSLALVGYVVVTNDEKKKAKAIRAGNFMESPEKDGQQGRRLI
jgi:hypothetical protein